MSTENYFLIGFIVTFIIAIILDIRKNQVRDSKAIHYKLNLIMKHLDIKYPDHNSIKVLSNYYKINKKNQKAIKEIKKTHICEEEDAKKFIDNH